MDLYRQDLIKLLNDSRALAMMILHGDSIASRAGGLSEQGFQSLRTALLKYWTDPVRKNLNRYVGLSLDNRFFLVFAKFLPDDDHLIGLVFPLQVPLIRIRQDMTEFQRAVMALKLKSPDLDLALEQSLHIAPIPNHSQDEPNTHLIAGWHPEQNRETNYSEDFNLSQEKTPQPEQFHDSEHTSTKRYLTYGAPMKGDPRIPQQDIRAEQEDTPWYLIEESYTEVDEKMEPAVDLQEPSPVQLHRPFESLVETTHPGDDLANILQDSFEIKDDLAGVIDWGLPPESNLEPQLQPEDLDGEDTSPIDIQTDVEDWEEDISETTFYLVPRLETHYILGELSQRLRTWLPAICKRYGWQLSLLSVRPDYLKWTLSDFPGSLIQKMLGAFRRETSERIFHVFPDLQKGNQSGDYWSPGYLVDTQHRDFSTQALISHFSQDRAGSK